MPAFGAARHAMPKSGSGCSVIGSVTKSFVASRANSIRSSPGNSKMDFGAYLLATSPPVNFANSYGTNEQGYDPGGIKTIPLQHPNQIESIPENVESKSSGEPPSFFLSESNNSQNVSPSLMRKTFGNLQSLNESVYLYEKKIKPCLKTWSLYDIEHNTETEPSKANLQVETCNRFYSDSSLYLRNCTVNEKLKKKVSFADDIGRHLTLVRIFEEQPDLPTFNLPSSLMQEINENLPSPKLSPISRHKNSVKSFSDPELNLDKHNDNLSSSQDTGQGFNRSSSRKCIVVPNFPMPAASYVSFRNKIEETCVSLENVHQLEYTGNIWGTIKVKEIAYEKQVFVRVTFDGWETTKDVQAEYSPPTDAACVGRVLPFATFSFRLELPDDSRLVARRGIQFAVCYRTDGKEFWDNNSNNNYELRCPDWAESESSGTNLRKKFGQGLSASNSKSSPADPVDGQGWGSYAAWSDADTTLPYW